MALQFMIYWRKLLQMNNKFIKTLLLVLSLLLILFFYKPFFKNQLYESDDYQLHVARAANYYLALKQGQFPVRWAPNLNDGLGYPSFNFMYPLPYLIASIYHFLGFPIQQSLNLSMLSSIILIALGMFFLGLIISKRWLVSVSGTLAFVFSPYILLNVFWRGAIGESFFIAFFLFFFYGVLLHLSNLELKKTNWLSLLIIVFSTSGMILTHFPSMLLTIGLIVSFCLALLISKKNKLNDFFGIALSQTLGFLISAWYWLPAILEKKFITYDSGSSLEQYKTQFLGFNQALKVFLNANSSQYFLEVIQVGLPAILIITFCIVIILKQKKITFFMGWLIVLILASVFLFTPESYIIWNNISLVQFIQYPWRLLWIFLFAASVSWFVMSKQLSNKIITFSSLFLIMVSIISAQNYSVVKGSSTRSDFDWYESVITGSSFDEHQPIWSSKPYDFPEPMMYLKTADLESFQANLQLLPFQPLNSLDAEIVVLNGSRVEYAVSNDQDLIVAHKRLFFPGWSAYLNDQKTEISKDIPRYQGVISIFVPAGNNTVKLIFDGNTKVRDISEFISLASIFLLLLLLLKAICIKESLMKN